MTIKKSVERNIDRLCEVYGDITQSPAVRAAIKDAIVEIFPGGGTETVSVHVGKSLYSQLPCVAVTVYDKNVTPARAAYTQVLAHPDPLTLREDLIHVTRVLLVAFRDQASNYIINLGE